MEVNPDREPSVERRWRLAVYGNNFLTSPAAKPALKVIASIPLDFVGTAEMEAIEFRLPFPITQAFALERSRRSHHQKAEFWPNGD